jgi:nitrile hydratase
MDGIHDLGGRQGFGPIRYAAGAPVFHAAWEKRVNALYGMAVRRGMPARYYLSASYYERSLTSLATLCVEKGIVAREELEKLAQGAFPLSEPSAPGRSNLPDRETFQAGDRVRVKNDFFAGHVRMPGYIRGKPGVVVSESPRYPFPDAHAHGVEAADEPTYDVAFRTEDLWPNSADKALVHVGVFQSYLVRVT